jgi:integrase
MRRDREALAPTLPAGKSDHLIPDGTVPGLALRLRASGSRTWIFSYRIGSKQRRIALGSATVLGVAEARRRATQLYANVKLGNDPAERKAEAKLRAVETVEAMVPVFLARQKERLRPRSFIGVERHLLTHAKRLHHLPLTNVTRRDVATVLSSLAGELSGATVNRARSSLSSFFAWCIREGLIEANPVVFTERREEADRTRLISDTELHEIWSALRADAYGDIVRLLLLTGARREEIGALRWSEIDFEQSRITLPSARTKNKRPHEIFLNDTALAILRGRSRLTWPDGAPCDLIFGRGRRGFNDWNGAKIDLDRRLDQARQAASVAQMPQWTLHDFRRYLSTTMHDRLAIAPHIVESILGHVGHQGGVAGRYNLATYRAEKAAALTRWSNHIAATIENRCSKIVPLRAGQ